VNAFLGRIAETATPRLGRGQCIEQYGPGEAYLPVLEALGRMGRDPRDERLVQTLIQYALTWLAQLPALLTDSDLESVQRRSQGATRDRMLCELLVRLRFSQVRLRAEPARLATIVQCGCPASCDSSAQPICEGTDDETPPLARDRIQCLSRPR
jgi:hypothetical protein